MVALLRLSLLALMATTLGCSSVSNVPDATTAPLAQSSEFAALEAPPRCFESTPPKPIKTPPPFYPPDFRLEHIFGSVSVSAIVTQYGAVRDVRVIKSDHSKLSSIALSAVQEWQYEPATCDGVPVEVRITTTLRFSQ